MRICCGNYRECADFGACPTPCQAQSVWLNAAAWRDWSPTDEQLASALPTPQTREGVLSRPFGYAGDVVGDVRAGVGRTVWSEFSVWGRHMAIAGTTEGKLQRAQAYAAEVRRRKGWEVRRIIT